MEEWQCAAKLFSVWIQNKSYETCQLHLSQLYITSSLDFVNFNHWQSHQRLSLHSPAPTDQFSPTLRNPKLRDKEIHFGGSRGNSVYTSGDAAVATTTTGGQRRGPSFSVATAQRNLSWRTTTTMAAARTTTTIYSCNCICSTVVRGFLLLRSRIFLRVVQVT